MNHDDPFVENADLVRAIEDAPPRGDIPLPQRQLFKLERARRDALRTKGVTSPILTKDKPRLPSVLSRASGRSTSAGSGTNLLRWAAILVALGVVIWLVLPRSTPTANVALTSPAATISETQPVIAWTSKDKPGQKYDVWILPAEGDYLTAPALFKAEKVTSPVAFTAMKPGKDITDTALKSGMDYRVLICLADAGRMAGVPVSFRVIGH
ncbi:MAG: hypothetical protein ACOYOF_05125 [Verrucomicrobiaceae bacterium]